MPKFIKDKTDEIFIIPDNLNFDVNEFEVLEPNTKDAALEKHVPLVNVNGNTVKVSVGEVEHPMLDEHYINDVILITDKGVYKKGLKPGNSPEVEFIIDEDEIPQEVYEFCNLHGLWKKEL